MHDKITKSKKIVLYYQIFFDAHVIFVDKRCMFKFMFVLCKTTINFSRKHILYLLLPQESFHESEGFSCVAILKLQTFFG